MPVPTLQTEHVSLRAWQSADAPRLFEILQEEGILRYFPNQTPPPIERVERYIQRHQTHWEERGCGHWAVTVEGQVMGWCGLEYLPESDETEVAYLLSHACWGKGLATEAACASVRFGFQQAGLSKIIGLVHPENIASRRVLEKSGLHYIDRKEYFGIDLDRFWVEKAEWEGLNLEEKHG
ncbi:MAG TPA: GNAT family N-acetyltransferase [Anaerolineaceae bacterium]|nr:GNAT family N-acetyltransferase [Anaerolineaceae bacterium]HPN50960.1 GNAT family N-acetyltransferase [Anaerolineaceae bacterium]